MRVVGIVWVLFGFSIFCVVCLLLVFEVFLFVVFVFFVFVGVIIFGLNVCVCFLCYFDWYSYLYLVILVLMIIIVVVVFCIVLVIGFLQFQMVGKLFFLGEVLLIIRVQSCKKQEMVVFLYYCYRGVNCLCFFNVFVLYEYF